jgi:iron complex transport system ATP-binding protein
MLSASDVWFGYDHTRPVLRGVSVDVPPTAIVGVLGPNGSGKTTLLRILAGTRQPQRGTVTFDGAPLARFSRPALARRMAVVPQETQLAFDYTAGEVAMMGRYAHLGAFEIEGPGDIAAIDGTLASTGTLHLKDRPFATLSGGEKQRVIIASALAQIDSAGVLLLDEPTASLDLRYQLEIADLLRRLHRERQVSIVISTHDLALAGALCHRLVLIRDGTVTASGPADDILTPENIRRVYDVDAEIVRPESAARVVIPIRRGRE